jgi:hypothetical protein
VIGPPPEGYESAERRRLWWVRLLALFAGMAALALAMIVFPDAGRPRDWTWAIGVALLVLALVANRLIARSAPPS